MRFPASTSVRIFPFLAAVLIMIFLGAIGCTSMPQVSIVKSVEITQLSPKASTDASPTTGHYRVTLNQPATEGQEVAVKIFEDDEILDDQVLELTSLFETGSLETTGTFELACASSGDLIGGPLTERNCEYEVYASAVDHLGNTVEEPFANRVTCVASNASP